MKYLKPLIGIPALFASACAEEIDTATRSAFALPGGYIVGIIIAALVIALITVAIMRGKLKTASRQYSASNYVREGSFKLRVSHDHFLYKTETRRKIEQKKN